jgi:hypothetical protein
MKQLSFKLTIRLLLMTLLVLIGFKQLDAQNNNLNLAGLSTTTAKAAYSLRQLSSSYSSSAILVRRSSDNLTQGIGFVNGNLDTATLKTFVGGNNGFIDTWYDQTGNGNNIRQTTTANHPLLWLQV